MNKACIASRLPDAIFSISASSEVLRALRGGRPAERRGVDPAKSLRIGRSPVFRSTDMGRTRAGNLLLTTSQTGTGFSGAAASEMQKSPAGRALLPLLVRCGGLINSI